MNPLKQLAVLNACLAPAMALAQALEPGAQAGSVLQPVVITGAAPGRSLGLSPATVDVVDGDELRSGALQVNLSENLGRVPGLLIQNRQNYAQDLQISVRGYGARSTFGVRGVRLYVDGIPASAPDGQGQASNFPLGIAQRVEVVRGPFAALYGSSAGGVIALFSEEGRTPSSLQLGAAGGVDGAMRVSAQAQGQAGLLGYVLDVSSFATDGLRPQSAARRDTQYLKLSHSYDSGRVIAIVNRQTGAAQDPLGLSLSEFDANPYQVTLNARTFNTRKQFDQTQLGAAWEHRLGGGHRLELMGYVGQRAVMQYQAIPASTQLAATSPGGVIALDRGYGGINARWRVDSEWRNGRLTASAGFAFDRQDEWRRGFDNFTGAATAPIQLGVTGRLRRDEDNTVTTWDPYVQIEWQNAAWTLTAGIRQSGVRMTSNDHYIAVGNPDDSGSAEYSGTMPVLGLRYRLSSTLQVYASTGLGFETPTLNEVAYRISGAGGLNSALQASHSRNSEAGLRGRYANGSWTATVFDIRTDNEIAVLSNTGGRPTFQNAGRSVRQGLEISAEVRRGELRLNSALTRMDATYSDGFRTCVASPCVTPTLDIPAGNRIPGIPRQQVFAKLAWEPKNSSGVFTAEIRDMGSLIANDTNTDAADAYTVLNVGAQFQQISDLWEWTEFVRIDNVANRVFVGSVIVNEGNSRYFETGAGRSLLGGVTLRRRFR